MLALFLLAAAPAQAGSTAIAVLPNGSSFTLEVADDPETRRVGYMDRDVVGPAAGMLFVFEEDAVHSMWMKNCKVGLDMVWLDAAYRVVEVASDTKPCPAEGECPSIIPKAASRFVIEFAAGTAARESLRVGDAVTVLRSPPGS
jgi:uncharacterized membrane protein (UPF0127 family)